MKRILLSIPLLSLALIGCEHDSHPVQEIDRATRVDVYAYSPGKYNPEDKDTIYYELSTRYKDVRIKDYGTKSFIDSIVGTRKKDAVRIQNEYEELAKRTK
jgi:hypothetical protein